MNELEQLMQEAKEIQNFLKTVPQLEERLKELIGSWGKEGVIEKKKRLIEESKMPVFESNWKTLRIKNIDDKWIYLKSDGFSSIKQYKKINGWPKGSRDGYGKINAEKAIKIWSEHNEQH